MLAQGQCSAARHCAGTHGACDDKRQYLQNLPGGDPWAGPRAVDASVVRAHEHADNHPANSKPCRAEKGLAVSSIRPQARPPWATTMQLA